MYRYEDARQITENLRRTTAATYVAEPEPRRPTLKLDKIVEEPNDQKTNVQLWLQSTNFTKKPRDEPAISTNC